MIPGVRRFGALDDHQVARHEVAVDEDLGLGQRRVDQELEGPVEHRLFFVAQYVAEVAADEPFREQVELAAQQGGVVGRQGACPGRQLPVDQHVEHRAHQRVGQAEVGVQRVEIADAAEVGEQQEAVVKILVQYPWRGEPGLGQQAGDMDEGPAVFLVGRGVHQDARAAVRLAQAEIAAETGVRRGRGDLDRLIGKATGDPVCNKLIARQGLHKRAGFGSL
jgi:hypothetical protein